MGNFLQKFLYNSERFFELAIFVKSHITASPKYRQLFLIKGEFELNLLEQIKENLINSDWLTQDEQDESEDFENVRQASK